MKTVEEWKGLLRDRLRRALAEKDKAALAVVREALAAIDNAEAPAGEASSAAASAGAETFAGSAGALGAGEVARLNLSPEDVLAIVEREIHEKREAADTYARLGRQREAEALRSQAELLASLVEAD